MSLQPDHIRNEIQAKLKNDRYVKHETRESPMDDIQSKNSLSKRYRDSFGYCGGNYEGHDDTTNYNKYDSYQQKTQDVIF